MILPWIPWSRNIISKLCLLGQYMSLFTSFLEGAHIMHNCCLLYVDGNSGFGFLYVIQSYLFLVAL